MKLRVENIVHAGETAGHSLWVPAVAVLLVTLFAWTLATAAEPAERTIRTAQLQHVSGDDATPPRPSHGVSDRERALFRAPPSMIPSRAANLLPDDLYGNQGRLSARPER